MSTTTLVNNHNMTNSQLAMKVVNEIMEERDNKILLKPPKHILPEIVYEAEAKQEVVDKLVTIQDVIYAFRIHESNHKLAKSVLNAELSLIEAIEDLDEIEDTNPKYFKSIPAAVVDYLSYLKLDKRELAKRLVELELDMNSEYSR